MTGIKSFRDAVHQVRLTLARVNDPFTLAALHLRLPLPDKRRDEPCARAPSFSFTAAPAIALPLIQFMRQPYAQNRFPQLHGRGRWRLARPGHRGVRGYDCFRLNALVRRRFRLAIQPGGVPAQVILDKGRNEEIGVVVAPL